MPWVSGDIGAAPLVPSEEIGRSGAAHEEQHEGNDDRDDDDRADDSHVQSCKHVNLLPPVGAGLPMLLPGSNHDVTESYRCIAAMERGGSRADESRALDPYKDPPAKLGSRAALAATLAAQMASGSPSQLRVLIADGREGRAERVASVVAGLGHDVIARDTTLSDVGEHTAAERPDVALVILGESSQQALDQIGLIVKEAACPCIAILDVSDPEFVNEAAKLGIFAYVSIEGAATDLQSSIDIVLRRFAEYHNLEGAFARRAITERAKGVLMERHGVDEGAAFLMIRDHSRRTNRKMVDVADAIIASLALLPSNSVAQDSDGDPFGPAGL